MSTVFASRLRCVVDSGLRCVIDSCLRAGLALCCLGIVLASPAVLFAQQKDAPGVMFKVLGQAMLARQFAGRSSQ